MTKIFDFCSRCERYQFIPCKCQPYEIKHEYYEFTVYSTDIESAVEKAANDYYDNNYESSPEDFCETFECEDRKFIVKGHINITFSIDE